MQKLRSIGVNSLILQNFYRCFIESILTFGFLCWYGGLSEQNRNVLKKVVKVCAKIAGIEMKSLDELYKDRVVKKGTTVVRDPSHNLCECFQLLPSGRRYRSLAGKKIRTRNSFIYKAIELFNNNDK